MALLQGNRRRQPGGMTQTLAQRTARQAETDGDAIVASGVRRSYPTRTKFNPLTGRRHPVEFFEAVRGVDLRVGRGELFALLGTNGAGKTSTVELVEGLARPTAGSIRVLGHDPVAERRVVRPRTGAVLQTSGFPPSLTVAEVAASWHGLLTRPRPVAEMLEAVDMHGRAKVEVSKLSGGERRRLDVALALMGRPDVLILDEPTTGLDPESRRNIWQLVRETVADGAGVLLTTHYLEEAESLAQRIAIMHEGTIAVEGTLSEIVSRAPARISFERPADVDPGHLDPVSLDLPGARIHVGERVVIETDDLQRDLARVLRWAGADRLRSLEARSASLEQVFLAIADQNHR